MQIHTMHLHNALNIHRRKERVEEKQRLLENIYKYMDTCDNIYHVFKTHFERIYYENNFRIVFVDTSGYQPLIL